MTRQKPDSALQSDLPIDSPQFDGQLAFFLICKPWKILSVLSILNFYTNLKAELKKQGVSDEYFRCTLGAFVIQPHAGNKGAIKDCFDRAAMRYGRAPVPCEMKISTP